MNMGIVNVMGMPLEEWKNESCTAHFGTGEGWATLYDIVSQVPSAGHATALLTETKAHYEKEGKTFGGSVALNPRMAAIYERLGITEYR